MRKIIILSILAALLFSCAPKKNRMDWTATEYFKYAMKKYQDKDYYDAVNEFTVVVLRFAGSVVADSAQFYLADSHYKMGEYLVSAVEFEKLVSDMSKSPLVAEAQYKIGECYNEMSPRASLDQKYSFKAIREYQIFIEDFPTHKLKEDAEKKITVLRSKLAKKDLYNAAIYRKMHRYTAALIYYDLILEKYYDTEWADDALNGKIETYLELKDKQSAKKEIEKFKIQFPSSTLTPAGAAIVDNVVRAEENE
ncbi:MAG: outer membrane protein assembly factor BamD [Calditrichaceae bacterium]